MLSEIHLIFPASFLSSLSFIQMFLFVCLICFIFEFIECRKLQCLRKWIHNSQRNSQITFLLAMQSVTSSASHSAHPKHVKVCGRLLDHKWHNNNDPQMLFVQVENVRQWLSRNSLPEEATILGKVRVYGAQY